MTNGGHRIRYLLGASMLVLAAPGHAAASADDAATAEQGGAPSVPAARSQRLNPTGRAIVLTVPAKDGATYLGDLPLTIEADDTLVFPTERALQLLEPLLKPDISTALRANFAGKGTIGPADLDSAGIGTEYDPRTLELHFLIPVEKRAERRLSVSALDQRSIGNFVAPAGVSGYLNVRSSVDVFEDGADTGFQSPVILLNAALRVNGPVLESDAIYIPGSPGTDFQRLGSRLVIDDTKDLLRFTAGDLEAQGRGFQAAPDIAGISILRSYSALNPQQVIRPRGDRTFRLERPSTVEVIVNGQQVRRLQLAPGNYNLRDFPFAQGGNDIRLNVLDDSGRSEVLRFNIFLDQTQLAKGLDEFGLYAGVKAPLGPHGPVYSNDWVVSGFYRRGISDAVTLGANFQADDTIQMAGVEAMLGTSFGSLGTHVAYSHTKGVGDGFAVQATFQRIIQHRNGQADTFTLFGEHRSQRFAPITFFLADNQYDFELGGGYSHAFSSDLYMGVDARFSKGRGTNPDVHAYTLSGGWRLSPRATLTAETRYNQDTRGDFVSGFLTLTVRLGRASSIRSEYDTRDNRARLSYQTMHGTGVGSYNVTADVERSDFGSNVGLNANYFTNRAELGISHYGTFNGDFGTSSSQRTTFRLGASLAYAGGEFSVGRPIYDSFAIIQPHKSLKKANVIVEPTPLGYTANTGKTGMATLPSLSSYSDRVITVDAEGVAPGVDIGQGTFKVFPAYRSGYFLEVGSDYHITALGTMLDIDGQPVSLVSGKATELAHPDRNAVTLFTNRQGRFGASGLAPGRWRLEMLDQKKSVYVITIPESADGVVRLGEITPVKE